MQRRFVASDSGQQNMSGQSDVQPTNLLREGEKNFLHFTTQPEPEGCEKGWQWAAGEKTKKIQNPVMAHLGVYRKCVTLSIYADASLAGGWYRNY